jgi:hypothetical protein
MKLPKEYMADANIRAALITLTAAIETSLKLRDANLKTLLVVALPDDMQSAAATIGCCCDTCKSLLFQAAGDVCLGKTKPREMEPFITAVTAYAKGIH